jgi:hypothetical protein
MPPTLAGSLTETVLGYYFGREVRIWEVMRHENMSSVK